MRLFALLALLALSWLPTHEAHAIGPGPTTHFQVIGHGCTTAYYIDSDCDGCGVGVKASATTDAGYIPTQSQTNQPVNTPAWYTMGDTPDADDHDPAVCTTADWQAKWGWALPDSAADNTVMQGFLASRKGFANTSSPAHIYYISLSGNDLTGTPDNPALPYLTAKPVLTALAASTTLAFSGNATLVSGSNVITITSVISGSLTANDLIVGTKLAANTYIAAQINGTYGGAGTYLMTAIATGTVGPAPESVTGRYLNGGAIVVRAGVHPNFNSNLGGNPTFLLAGSPAHPLYVMAYPGEIVQILNTFTNGISSTLNPASSGGYLTMDGFQFYNTPYGQGSGVSSAHATQFKVINSEFAGGDHGVIFSDGSVDISMQYDVFHDIFAHAVYYAFSTGDPSKHPNCGGLVNNAGGDENFNLDWQNWLAGISCGASYRGVFSNNVVYSSGQSGFDPIHINTTIMAPVVQNNIVSFAGGAGIGLQSGDYNALVTGNLVFDVKAACFDIFPNNNAAPGTNIVATERWNTFMHNVCWTGDATPFRGVTGAAQGLFEANNATVNPADHYIKDTVFLNNLVETYDVAFNTDGMPFDFITNCNCFPTSHIIRGNTFWSIGTQSNRLAVVGTGSSAFIPAATYTFAAFTILPGDAVASTSASTITDSTVSANHPFTSARSGYISGSCGVTATEFNILSIGGFSGAWTITTDHTLGTHSTGCTVDYAYDGNTYADPGFQNAAVGLLFTPGQFNFAPYNLH